MPKSANQKRKLLYLKRILEEKTDDSHALTIPQMIEELGRYGISAERKSIYDDLEALRLYGLDIEKIKSKTTGYYVANRRFELPELKLLADSVQVSRFITHRKSVELIKKIESLCSVYEAQQLQRQIYVTNRIKTVNESIYYNVDRIHTAIGQDKKISFLYFEYTVEKKRRFRRDGQRYVISPCALTWDDENYYMLGYDAPAGQVKHYRVDKMTAIELLDETREGKEHYQKMDMAAYSQKMFSMFGGQEQQVEIAFSESLIGVVIDRFGESVHIRREKDGWFVIRVLVAVSPQFFAWIFSFGEKARILSPESVKKQMQEQLMAAEKQYKTE